MHLQLESSSQDQTDGTSDDGLNSGRLTICEANDAAGDCTCAAILAEKLQGQTPARTSAVCAPVHTPAAASMQSDLGSTYIISAMHGFDCILHLASPCPLQQGLGTAFESCSLAHAALSAAARPARAISFTSEHDLMSLTICVGKSDAQRQQLLETQPA